MKGSHQMPTTKLILFTVSKDEWHTKEDLGKYMKNALYTLWCAKRHALQYAKRHTLQYAKRYLLG